MQTGQYCTQLVVAPIRVRRFTSLRGLSAAKDFTLTDNGVPQKIVSFAASKQPTNENERLTEVALVLDEVELSLVQLELVQDESIKFLRQNGGHLGELDPFATAESERSAALYRR
jgi:hypothetical protein